MKKILVTASILLFSINLFGQINMNDSTVQVVGYWSMLDKQAYNVTHEKYKIKDADTIAREFISYEVNVTIKDSTDNSYTIEWFYKNFLVETDNELIKKVASIAEDMPVVIRTDAFGAIQEVVNWQDVVDYIQKAVKILRKELKEVPNADQIIAQAKSAYMSEEAIRANAIKDAQQFYTFHGGKYRLGEEYTGQLQMMNNFGGAPFDTEVTVILDEINEEDGNSIIRMYQQVNSQQLTDATYEYLKQLGTFGDHLPARDAFPPLSNETWTASRIHGATGWIIYSIETKQTSAEGTINIEERIIQLQ